MFDHHQETEETLSIPTQEQILLLKRIWMVAIYVSLYTILPFRGENTKQLIWERRHFNPDNKKIF